MVCFKSLLTDRKHVEAIDDPASKTWFWLSMLCYEYTLSCTIYHIVHDLHNSVSFVKNQGTGSIPCHSTNIL